PSAAADGAGHFLVAWQSQGQDGSGLGVYARRFGAADGTAGPEFLVNTEPLGDQMRPSVAASPAGFVVAWDAQNQPDQGATLVDVYARLFDVNDVPRGQAFRVNTTVEDRQSNPAVGMAADGSFVVAWTDR